MQRHLWLILCVLVALAACAPQQGVSEVVLPTLAVLPSTPEYALEDATQTALNFLESWRVGDFPAMYALTTFSSQEATPLDRFTAIYQTAQNEMTFTGLSYTGVTVYREDGRDDLATFNYNLTFDTRLMGRFTDNDRDMTLIVDPTLGGWRIAWTPGDFFREMSGGGQLRLEISEPSRANIYDARDRILADQNGRVVTVRAVKRAITDWPACLARLAPALIKDPAALQAIYDESASDWLMELGVIEPATYEASAAQLEAVCAAQFSSRPTRRYPDGTTAPHIVGSVGFLDAAQIPAIEAAGFDSDSILGRSGIESSWDERLRGQPGGRLVIVSPGGGVVRELARSISRPPESIWLTIDRDLQAEIERIFATYYQDGTDGWAGNSKGAAAVVLDVRTGAVLAMVSYPFYDANIFSPFPSMGRAEGARLAAELQTDPRRPLLNRATQGLYPLGSVMKTVSAMAVADTGVFAFDRRFSCSGVWERDIVRYDWLAGGHGTVTISSALTQSCNPFFYEVGYELNQYDPEALPEYANRMGLGVSTGLTDIPEQAGQVPNPDWKRVNLGLEWTFSDAVNISIGQGEVQVTPLQVARLFAAVANGGTLYRPQLVAKVGILGEAPSYTMTPDAMSSFNVRPEVLELIREGLCNVTTAQSGTAEYQFRNSDL
ncbi:MAG: hypothetical protein JNJ61_03905, partial [Anaerolineae bacterium]|nr:hypothetical protein [Anaerolineae bacterium]